VTEQVLNHFSLSFEQFRESYVAGMEDPENSEAYQKHELQIVQMQINLRRKEKKKGATGPFAVLEPKDISRQEAVKIFKFQTVLRKEILQVLDRVDESQLSFQLEYDV